MTPNHSLSTRCRYWLAFCVWGLMAGCASHSLEQRAGYRVDSSHHSSAFNQRIRYLVLHYTDSDAPRALKTLMGPDVSAHYLVPRELSDDGHIHVMQLVDEDRRAWHAGVSAWQDRTQINDTSIGVEIVNRGPQHQHGVASWQSYPDAQIRAVIALAKDIVTRYDLPPPAVLGHSDIAPSRKIDPGPRFPWHRLYLAGVGAWPHAADVARYQRRFVRCPPSIDAYQAALSTYGYALEVSGELDPMTRDVTRAFQMHFRPANTAGNPDVETQSILWALLKRYRPDALTMPALPDECAAGSGSDREISPGAT
ncbi:N-acetylmuramoyl-L-alanine amidase [Salinicola rhizosphaerae]|uniref:N-acetylmuramoyl-L-alanine amidase n=1 Tax=Salinicola rhizosphaerae TaxID=1443141 RepID=A0ABQ3DRQ6_9GAMM|nr:N-acetylmuramoyl-L-alanine amidase [Salinicola rhizosphaerae]GHB08471.1 N-acetylmuramoyl-L-alanine amidase [Salinicola rhizosphaerae]